MEPPATMPVVTRRAVLIGGCALALAEPERLLAVPQLSIVDMYPELFRLWSETAAAPAEERARQFIARLVQPNRQYFEGFTGSITAERLLPYFRRLAPAMDEVRRLHQWVETGLPSARRRFNDQFPRFSWPGPVVFMPNLFGFDAGVGRIDGREILVFGLDTIAVQSSGSANLPVLFNHELFHIYHSSLHEEWRDKRRGRDIPLFWLVWGEGLATYVSRRLNPGVSLDTALLSPTLRSAVEPRLSSFSSLLLANLDNPSNAAVMDWMSGRPEDARMPPRVGYYLGVRLAQALGRRRTLDQLARLPATTVRSEAREVLARWSARRQRTAP